MPSQTCDELEAHTITRQREVDEADAAEIKEGVGINTLWEQGDVRLIKLLESTEGVELAKGIIDVFLTISQQL